MKPVFRQWLLRRDSKHGETPDVRVFAILSKIEQAIHRHAPLRDLVEAIESSKHALQDCLRPSFDSPVISKALTLKILNLCLAKYHLAERSTTLLSRPFGLNIDPSDACNLACPGCVHSNRVKELKLFDWDKKILTQDRLATFLTRYGPSAIHTVFCNYGEPLINPETPKLIRLAKSYLIQAMTSTNLSIRRFDAQAYVESGLDYMIVSIDGATQPVYEKFRRNGNLDLVLRNIQMLVQAKKELGKRTPIIAWRFLTFQHNIHEVPLAVEKARVLGVDQFLTLTPYDVSWDDPAIQPAAAEPVNISFNPQSEACMLANWNPFPESLEACAIESEFEAGWSDRIESEVGVNHQNRAESSTCQWLYKSLTVDAGGRIFPCCAPPQPGKDLIFANSGNLPESDLYNSDRYRLARLSFTNPEGYRRERESLGLVQDPHCVHCEWDKDHVTTDRPQIRTFLRAAGAHLFNRGSVDILSNW